MRGRTGGQSRGGRRRWLAISATFAVASSGMVAAQMTAPAANAATAVSVSALLPAEAGPDAFAWRRPRWVRESAGVTPGAVLKPAEVQGAGGGELIATVAAFGASPAYRQPLSCLYEIFSATGCRLQTGLLPQGWVGDQRQVPAMAMSLSMGGILVARDHLKALAEELRTLVLEPIQDALRQSVSRPSARRPAAPVRAAMPVRIVKATRVASAPARNALPPIVGATTAPSAAAMAIPVLAAVAAGAPHNAWGRDPFAAPVDQTMNVASASAARPTGLEGINLDELDVQAVALGGANGAVALVEGPQKRTYFLRAGSQLLDARVVRVEPNGVVFERSGDSQDPHAQVLRKVGQGPVGAHTQ